MKPVTILLALLACFRVSAFAADAPCDDAGKVYKVCSDQEASYKEKLKAAKKEKKMLVVVMGAEWCPWCMAMHKMLGDPAFSEGFAKKFVLADVGVYNGKQKVESGEKIYGGIQAKSSSKQLISDGIPILAVVNPKNGRAAIINTEPLEQNTETSKGHDPKKVLAALEKAATELN